MIGPPGFPGYGVEIFEGLVGILENEPVALFSSQTEVLVVGRKVQNVFAKVDAKGPGPLVRNLDRKKDKCNPVLFLHDRCTRLEGKGRVGSDRTARNQE